jgi:excisionase family DNA binding protein
MKPLTSKEMKKLLTIPIINVEQAGRILGVSRNVAYEAVKNKQIPAIRIGRSIKISTGALKKMLDIK